MMRVRVYDISAMEWYPSKPDEYLPNKLKDSERSKLKLWSDYEPTMIHVLRDSRALLLGVLP